MAPFTIKIIVFRMTLISFSYNLRPVSWKQVWTVVRLMARQMRPDKSAPTNALPDKSATRHLLPTKLI